MKSLNTLMECGITEGVFPGGVLLVAGKGEILFIGAYGYADLFSRRKMTPETIFDLASLTKPLATALAVLHLHQGGKLNVEQPVADLLPIFQGREKNRITLWHLLVHESGLPAYRPYYLGLAGVHPLKRKEHLRLLLADERLEYPIGSRVLYSDLGFMLLEWVAEAVAGRPLDVYLKKHVYGEIYRSDENGLFFPELRFQGCNKPFAATEFCTWRNRLMIGKVHDENAYVAGGISGHAGLFGSAGDVWRLLSHLIGGFHGKIQKPLFRHEIMEMAFRPSPVGGRAMGFDTPSPERASCGQHFSKRTVGHLGFTGTSFWIDLERDVTVILLTNRVHPFRGNEKIRTFRPMIHDAVMEVFG